jgi:recombination protein RecA
MAGKSMADVWKQMEKQHGSEGLFVGSEEKYGVVETLSTGSYLVDDALGFGIPKGHIVQYAGFQSSGKTLLALSTIAEYQKNNPEGWCMFIDAEYSWDREWAAKLGVDLDRIYVYKENNGVKIFERLIGQASKTPGKKAKQGVLDLELESGGTGLGIVVLDSVASMIPPVEEVTLTGGQSMAAMARFLPQELRRLTPMLSATGITFIAINQLREKPGVMYGDPTQSSGGNALRFACAQMVHLAKMTGADAKVERDGEQVGGMVRARIDKNKVNSPNKSAEFTIEYLKGIVNKGAELRDLGCKYGIIKRPNNRTYEYGGQSYNGKENIANALDPLETQSIIWKEIQQAKRQIIANGAASIQFDMPTDEKDDSEE